MATICKTNDEDNGDAEECLKDALLGSRIQTPACKVEVANMIEESQADIQVDPLLQQACALDLLNFCNDIPQGNGRRKIFNFSRKTLLIYILLFSHKYFYYIKKKIAHKAFLSFGNYKDYPEFSRIHSLCKQISTQCYNEYMVRVEQSLYVM